MKKLNKCRECIRASLARIHLVDKCLIVIFVVLLLQSAYSLFFHVGTNSEIEHIDVIVRTSLASIFGYVLSANFIRHPAKQSRKADTLKMQETAEESIEEPTEMPEDIDEIETEPEGKLQILIATIIGLFCLVVLLLLRNVQVWNTDLSNMASTAATVAQFRDIVSGCVGFLIGSPTGRL